MTLESTTPVERLRLQRMFGGLTRKQLQSILDIGNIFSVPAGEIIIQAGQEPSHLYFVLDGEADVWVFDAEHEQPERLMTTLTTGDSIGEYGFVDDRPTSATVRAVSRTDLFALAINVFKELLHHDIELENLIYKNLLTTLVDRLRLSNIVIEYLQSKDERPSPDLH